MQPLNRYKSSRIWNINANIIVADVISTAATAVLLEVLQASPSTHLSSRVAIVAITAIIDGAISLAIFAALHIYSNRERGMKDLVRVQIHRWLLSPLHYLIGSGLQFLLLAVGLRVGLGVLIAYWSSLAIVRATHTIYGKKSGLFQ